MAKTTATTAKRPEDFQWSLNKMTLHLDKEIEELNVKVGTLELNMEMVLKRSEDQGLLLDRMQERIIDTALAESRKQVAQDTMAPQSPPAKKPCKCQDKEEHQHGPDFADGLMIGVFLGVLITVGSVVWHRRLWVTAHFGD